MSEQRTSAFDQSLFFDEEAEILRRRESRENFEFEVLLADYAATFLNEDGTLRREARRVLRDVFGLCRMFATSFDRTGTGTVFNEGRRSVALAIAERLCCLPGGPDALAEVMRPEPQPKEESL